jgi:hypothetical protein
VNSKEENFEDFSPSYVQEFDRRAVISGHFFYSPISFGRGERGWWCPVSKKLTNLDGKLSRGLVSQKRKKYRLLKY